MVALVCGRLVIRAFQEEDAPLLMAYSQEEEARRELPDEVLSSLEEASARISFFARMHQEGAYPLIYAICLKDTNELIGHIGLSPIDGGVEVGYAVCAAHRGRGYAQEALAVFAPWCKRERGLSRLLGYAKADNAASCRVLEKAGFTLESERERQLFGGVHLVRHYAL